MVKRIEYELNKTVYQPDTTITARVLLAHGAGAGNRHEFMDTFANHLAEAGIEVHSINFPYMQMAYQLDKKRPPNGNKQLQSFFKQQVFEFADDLPLFLVGKSMGGRIATQIATEDEIAEKIAGVVVLGYPFMPPGKPEKVTQRVSHFAEIGAKTLILQGERDTFGAKALVSQQNLPSNISVNWLPSGDHSYKPLKSSGLSQAQNIKDAAVMTVQFMREEK